MNKKHNSCSKNGVFTVTSSDATFTIDSEDYDRVVFLIYSYFRHVEGVVDCVSIYV